MTKFVSQSFTERLNYVSQRIKKTLIRVIRGKKRAKRVNYSNPTKHFVPIREIYVNTTNLTTLNSLNGSKRNEQSE